MNIDSHHPEDECRAPKSAIHELGVINYRHPNIADPIDAGPGRICGFDRQVWPCEAVQAVRAAAVALAASYVAGTALDSETRDRGWELRALTALLGEVGFMRSCIASGEKLLPSDLVRQNAAMANATKLLSAPTDTEPSGLDRLVDEQAEDEGLWFVAQTAPEAYLQQELRRLHAAIEGAALASSPGVAEEGLREALNRIRLLPIHVFKMPDGTPFFDANAVLDVFCACRLPFLEQPGEHAPYCPLYALRAALAAVPSGEVAGHIDPERLAERLAGTGTYDFSVALTDWTPEYRPFMVELARFIIACAYDTTASRDSTEKQP